MAGSLPKPPADEIISRHRRGSTGNIDPTSRRNTSSPTNSASVLALRRAQLRTPSPTEEYPRGTSRATTPSTVDEHDPMYFMPPYLTLHRNDTVPGRPRGISEPQAISHQFSWRPPATRHSSGTHLLKPENLDLLDKESEWTSTFDPNNTESVWSGQATLGTQAFVSEPTSRRSSLPLLGLWSTSRIGEDNSNPSQSSLLRAASGYEHDTHGAAADSALTRIDVQATPARPNLCRSLTDGDEDRYISTKQIVRSNSGTFEVIWKEPIAVSQDFQPHLFERESNESHSSSDGGAEMAEAHPLHGRAMTPGLDRVSSKLSQWQSGSSEYFETFPFEEDDAEVRRVCSNTIDPESPAAPKNSMQSSSRNSRPSPHSDSDSDAPSPAKDIGTAHGDGNDPVGLGSIIPTRQTETQMIQPPRFRSNSLLKPPVDLMRSHSNLSAYETHFRGHRDSVTLMRQRMLHGSGASSEVNLRADSVVLDRKRIRNKKKADTGRDIQRPPPPGVDVLSPIPDASPPGRMVSILEAHVSHGVSED